MEDDLDTVHSTTRHIRMMGHECQFAINGFAALKIAGEFKPEIILLDIGLPDFAGYDIAKQLKYEPGLEETRIIAVSGRPASDRHLAIDAGCDEFYRKPLEIELLEELIANGSKGLSARSAAPKPVSFDSRSENTPIAPVSR